jgi:hypothetical protein
VYFLLVELLGFENLGQFEKLAWSIPVDLDGVAYLIEHRKFGVGVFVQNKEVDEPQAQRIVSLIKKGVTAAAPFFKWMAENAIQDSKLNVRNVSNRLLARYLYFRDSFREASTEADALKKDHEAELRQRQLSIYWNRSIKAEEGLSTADYVAKFTFRHIRTSQKASWLALSAIDAFFAWTEHIFIHIAILQGSITTGKQLTKLMGEEWNVKFKRAFDLNDSEAKKYLDLLIVLKRQLRNFMAHGAFGKEGEAFRLHSGAGAVPVVLEYGAAKPRFSLTPELGFNDEEALETIEKFIGYLWSGKREPARIYIQEHTLPLILPNASEGTYAAAMASVEDMREYIEHLVDQIDRSANMDW